MLFVLRLRALDADAQGDDDGAWSEPESPFVHLAKSRSASRAHLGQTSSSGATATAGAELAAAGSSSKYFKPELDDISAEYLSALGVEELIAVFKEVRRWVGACMHACMGKLVAWLPCCEQHEQHEHHGICQHDASCAV